MTIQHSCPFIKTFICYLLQSNFICWQMNDRFSDLVAKWRMSVEDLNKIKLEIISKYYLINFVAKIKG